MKRIKTIFTATLMAMAGTAGAQTTNYVHIIKTDGTEIQFSQTEIQSMTIDTERLPTDYVEFTHDGKTIKVATMNLGATTVAESAKTCYGNYYAWAATEPYCTVAVASNSGTATPKEGHSGGYKKENAPYYSGSGYTKYTSPGETLEASDDAATIEMGEGWHIPTQDEIQTLYNACGGSGEYMDITTISSGSSYSKGIYYVNGATTPVTIGSDTYKVNGWLFVQNATTHVFFPAAGYIMYTEMLDVGENGGYWSSTFYYDETYDNADKEQASSLWLRNDNLFEDVFPSSHDTRETGLTIRPFKN